MDQHEDNGRTTAARRGSLERKVKPEFEDRKAAKVLALEPRVHRSRTNRHSVVELPREVHSSPAITSTSFSMASHQTLPSPCPSVCNYEVFLSFRGEDTRKNFTDHLYSALRRVGIHTFRDEGELRRGENISTELQNAIHGSKISIVVLSKGYADSKWCLNELVEIMYCAKIRGQTLLPVFYHVDPSDIRKQTGTFADAFARHEELFHNDMERVKGWREALREASSRSGWDIKEVANGYESRLIDQIVKEVSSKLKPAEYLDVAIHPVGVNSRVEEMKTLLDLEKSDVRIVGIYGMGGIGKTTIAKAVYNQIRYTFEGSSCLFNIKEKSEQFNGLVHLQKLLLFDILKMKKFKIGSVDRGIRLIQERIQGKRVLVVLDDVDDLKQIYALVGQCRSWLGQGSRVIITTRNEHLLTQAQVNKKYEVRKMDEFESLQLFSWHAFGTAHPIEDYLDLSVSAMNYAGGLPLALEVLGCFLCRRSVIEWESELRILQKMPHSKIQKILKRSFDSLDDIRKIIFLDIACFFVGVGEEYVITILDGCGFPSISGINILVQRALLRIDNQKLVMHDLIRDMGREIVREESKQYPGKRSRLWFHNDVLSVLHKHTGSEAVQGLKLHGLEHLKTEAFANMQNLRLLQIDGVHLTGSYKYLSKELIWLCWQFCPLEFLPQNFHPENLVVLDMRYNNLKQIWKENRLFQNSHKIARFFTSPTSGDTIT
ncbi:disease resistance protein RPV1-like isoform X2 [Carya illinoinensis]|uniref:disease resistance protein RPV1-like isoform X2 n=1 Tax=Carya illinoinensis TaxID=32201 RepID=UPI001C727C2C|nr:disease resistance protein RPV1-like isoform X2 [Carya illinoinensis]